nr:MAG TPA: hypothetical protein [Caudoviricetes sp.]
MTWQAAPAIRRPRGHRQRAEPSVCRLLPAHGLSDLSENRARRGG